MNIFLVWCLLFSVFTSGLFIGLYYGGKWKRSLLVIVEDGQSDSYVVDLNVAEDFLRTANAVHHHKENNDAEANN